MKRFVKVNPDRGWAPGLYEVLNRRGPSHGQTITVRLAGTRGAGQELYHAHTFIDADCIRASKQYADQIGRKAA